MEVVVLVIKVVNACFAFLLAFTLAEDDERTLCEDADVLAELGVDVVLTFLVVGVDLALLLFLDNGILVVRYFVRGYPGLRINNLAAATCYPYLIDGGTGRATWSCACNAL